MNAMKNRERVIIKRKLMESVNTLKPLSQEKYKLYFSLSGVFLLYT